MMGCMKTLAAVIAGSLLLVPLAAQAAAPCLPQFEQGWLRPPVAGAAMPMAAGYGQLINPCDHPLQVVAVSSPAFASVSLHESLIQNGMSRMQPVPQLQLPAGARVTLAPGGYHLMLMQPKSPLQAGQLLPVQFTLADGSVLSAQLQVGAPTTGGEQ